jgi:hypothetical protein
MTGEYLIINLQRQGWTGKEFVADITKAKVYKEVNSALEACEPLILKTYIIFNYGGYYEREVYRNFEEGRSLTWGREERSYCMVCSSILHKKGVV